MLVLKPFSIMTFSLDWVVLFWGLNWWNFIFVSFLLSYRFQQRIMSHLNLEESPLPAQCILSHPNLDESSLPVQCRGRSLFPRSGLASRAVAPSMLQKRLIKPQTLLSYQCVSLRLMRIDPQIFSTDKQNTSIAAAAAFKLISRVVWKIYDHCCKLQATLSSIIWRLKC